MAEQTFRDFWTRYSNLCLKCKVCPLKSVIKHMKGTILCCQVERIRSEHWQFLLSALSVDTSLTEVCFKSDLPTLEEQKELWKKRRRKKDESYPVPYGYSPQNINDICKYSFRLLTISHALETLIIDNLPITKEDAGHLAEGLSATLIKEFAFRNYPYSDEVIETVCKGLGNSNVFLLDLSACNLSLRGLSFVCDVIKKHQTRRVVEAFPETLRYRTPVFEEMMGLSRIILNGNMLGDTGVEMICDTICDDRWIQALDLQCCGIFNSGAMVLLKLITDNSAMQVLDLRLNDIDDSLHERIAMQLGVNSFGKVISYSPLPLWKPRLVYKNPVRKTKLKTKVTKKYSKLPKLKKDFKSLEHAFRISCEIYDSKDAVTEDACVQTVINGDVLNLQERVKRLELRILKEMSMRESLIDLLERLKLENSNLRSEVMTLSNLDDVILIDQETYSEIKHVFEKFQKFLKLMKDYGLWGLVSTIGVAEYENTRLKAVPSDSRICLMRKEPGSPDGPPPPLNGPSNTPPTTKTQNKCCTCRKPGCISNQKAEKENNPSRNPECISNRKSEKENNASLKPESLPNQKVEAGNNASNLNQRKPPVKSQYKVDKAKVTKLFKNFQDTCRISSDASKPIPRLHRKHSLGDLPTGCKPAHLPFKSVSNTDIPNKFKQIKTRQDLYEAVKTEMERVECICQHHKSPEQSNPPPNNPSDVNDKSYYRNVSSQTAAVESLGDYEGQKGHPTGSAFSVPSKNHRTTAIPGEPAANLFQRKDWEEQGYTTNYIDPKRIATPSTKALLDDLYHLKNRAKAQLSQVAPTLDEPLDCSIGSAFKPPSTRAKSSSLEESVSEPEIKSKSSLTSSRDCNSESNPKSGRVSVHTVMKSLSEKYNKSHQDSASSKDGRSSSSKSNASSKKDVKSVSGKSNKSYLESVDDVSTDKDVKTVSGKSNKSYLESVSGASTDKDVESIPNSESFKSNQKSSSAANKAAAKPRVANSDKSSKSSKRNQKQKKNSNQNVSAGGKSPKGSVSSSSVPSLSDITTVSSRSLNNSLVEQFF